MISLKPRLLRYARKDGFPDLLGFINIDFLCMIPVYCDGLTTDFSIMPVLMRPGLDTILKGVS
jgi:hypothetical protein